MSRNVLDENYYVTSGEKIPVKWTAPEVSQCSIVHFIYIKLYYNRQCSTENTRCTVMFGAMVVCYMRYGVWDTNHLRT